MCATEPSPHRLSKHGERLLVAVWLAIVTSSLLLFQQYKATAGGFGHATARWPDDAPLPRATVGHTLLLFAHPRCPCTRASLNQLAIALARCSDDVRANVVFYRPDDDAGDSWSDTELVRRASKMTGVHILWDNGGSLARLYGVETSGHVLVFDQRGEPVYSGGITPLRGHEGDSPGLDALISCLSKAKQASRASDGTPLAGPVFGCPLGQPRRDVD